MLLPIPLIISLAKNFEIYHQKFQIDKRKLHSQIHSNLFPPVTMQIEIAAMNLMLPLASRVMLPCHMIK
jgi:hypothetical protein